MKAAWVTGKRRVEIIEQDYPSPGPDEVTVEVKACGICGTDLHFYREYPGGKPIPIGHELSAVVHQAGELVQGLRPGDKVIVQNNVPCGRCRQCLQGNPYACSDIQTYMNDSAAMAEFLRVRHTMVVPFWDLDFVGAAVAEPLTVALDITREAELSPFQNVLVSGPGIIGLFCTRIATMGGALRVAVAGRSLSSPRGRKRAEAARTMGASDLYDTDLPDWREHVKEAFPEGFDRIIVTSPPASIPPLLPLASFTGVVAFNGISFAESGIRFDANEFHFKKLKLKASHAIPNWGFPQALESLADGRFEYRDLVTHRYPFERLSEAFRTAASSDEGVIKVVVTFGS
jgi:L-iditol 2-dehydrogenase